MIESEEFVTNYSSLFDSSLEEFEIDWTSIVVFASWTRLPTLRDQQVGHEKDNGIDLPLKEEGSEAVMKKGRQRVSPSPASMRYRRPFDRADKPREKIFVLLFSNIEIERKETKESMWI